MSLKVVSLSHSLTFTVRDPAIYQTERFSESKTVAGTGKGGIPKSKWVLSSQGIRNDLWRIKVLLKNYMEFNKTQGIVTGFSNALLRNVGIVPDYRSVNLDARGAVCSQHDLPQIQLYNLTGDTVWSLDCDELGLNNVYIFDIKITLVYNEVVPNLSKLQSDFSSLLEHGHHSDFLLISEGREFSVHKSILSTRSDVFQAMFNHDMMEKRDNKVDITDVRSDVLEKMLMFMYSGNIGDCENDAEFLEQLFMAADKYAITDLKTEVAEKLCYGIAAENVSKRLVFAEKFEELAILKWKCVDFICNNRDALCDNTPAKRKKKAKNV